MSKRGRLFVCSTHPKHGPMTASEFEQHRAEQEREDSEEGYLQLGVIGAVMGGDVCARVPVEESDEMRMRPSKVNLGLSSSGKLKILI